MTIPPLFKFSDCGGNWIKYEAVLYDIFINKIARGGLSIKGVPVNCRRHPESRRKWFSFWHLIQEGKREDERTPELRRCERVIWIPYIINAFENDPNIDWWKNKRSNCNLLLWYREEYLVVLEIRKEYYLLKTAYYTNQEHRIKSLRKERDRYQASLKS